MRDIKQCCTFVKRDEDYCNCPEIRKCKKNLANGEILCRCIRQRLEGPGSSGEDTLCFHGSSLQHGRDVRDELKVSLERNEKLIKSEVKQFY